MDTAWFHDGLPSALLELIEVLMGPFTVVTASQKLFYLSGYVKFRSATNVLPFASREWIRNTEKTIYELLQETPPNGKKYVLFVKHLIEREAFWVKWKNEGCPRFMREKDKDGASRPKKRKTIYDDFMGNQKLGKLAQKQLGKHRSSSVSSKAAQLAQKQLS